MPALHHDDPVRHRHGFDLIVRDVDRRRLQALVQLADLGAHLNAQLGVEVRKRLVEKENLGIANDGPSHGNALALSAGQCAGIAIKIRCQAQDLGGLVHPPVDLGLVHLPHAQREGHIRAHRLVRIKRIVLKHHGDVAFRRRHAVHDAVADRNLPRGDPFKTRDHPQQCGFSTARGPDQNDELAIRNREVHAVDDLD